jgi:hypothetical protein
MVYHVWDLNFFECALFMFKMKFKQSPSGGRIGPFIHVFNFILNADGRLSKQQMIQTKFNVYAMKGLLLTYVNRN